MYQYHMEWPTLNRLSIAMHEQLEMEEIYHQMQQAMGNEWFSRYRLVNHFAKEILFPHIRRVGWGKSRIQELFEQGILASLFGITEDK